MDISVYLQQVREGIDNATALADADTKDVASRVASTVEPSVRLALIEAISDTANEINDELSTAEVTMTLVEGNPSFVIDEHGISVEQLASYGVDDAADEDDDGELEDDDEYDDDDDDESVVRFSLRLPKWAKDKVDRQAERNGMSTNAYLTELIVSQVASGRGRRGFGPGGPGFGPGFGPGGPGFGTRQGDFGRPGGPPGGPGFINPDTIMQLGRMFSQAFGDGGPGGRGPGGRGPGGRGPRGPEGRGRRGPGGRRGGFGPEGFGPCGGGDCGHDHGGRGHGGPGRGRGGKHDGPRGRGPEGTAAGDVNDVRPDAPEAEPNAPEQDRADD